MPSVPQTQVRLSHALTIKVNGVLVGFINGWNPTQSRTVTPIYEIGMDGSGAPVEHMPGNVTGQQVTISRYDTYFRRMEEAMGTPDLVMLTRQSDPFSILEAWKIPGEQNERFIYDGCWFTNLGRTIRSDGDRIVNVNATLVYTRKMKVTGALSGAVSVVNSINSAVRDILG